MLVALSDTDRAVTYVRSAEEAVLAAGRTNGALTRRLWEGALAAGRLQIVAITLLAALYDAAHSVLRYAI